MQRHATSGSPTPLWVFCVLGYLALGVLGQGAAEMPEHVRRAADELPSRLREGLDPARMSARELRTLPGVGAKRSLAIADARRAHREGPRGAEALSWDDVPGVGPRTSERVRAWLEEHGLAAEAAARILPACEAASLPWRDVPRRARGEGDTAFRPPPTHARLSGMVLPETPRQHMELAAPRPGRARVGLPLALALALGSCGGSEHASGLPGASEEEAMRERERGDAGEGVDPVEGVVAFELDVEGTAVHGLAAGPSAAPALLFLHGAAFRARTWEELGTLEHFAGLGYRVLAVDLPGFGDSGPTELEPATFLLALMDSLELERPLVVSPSMSGRFSLALLQLRPERFGAFAPVAPAGVESFGGLLGETSVPTLVVWGAQDRVFDVSGAERLAAKIPGAEVAVLEDADHPCYLDRPARFHELLAGLAERAFGR